MFKERVMKNSFLTGLLTIVLVFLMGCMLVIFQYIISDVFGDEVDSKNSVEVAKVENKNDIEYEKKVEIATREKIDTPQIIEQTLPELESTTSTSVPNITYTSSNTDKKHMYMQLDEYSKIIYDGLDNNIDNLKTGTYVIEYGDSFKKVLSNENGQEILGKEYQSAIEAFIYDNPNIFYLDPTKMFLNIQTITRGFSKTYNVYIGNGEEENYLSNNFQNSEQVEQCIKQIEQVSNNVISGLSGNDYNKIKQIHDYLVDNLSYDTTISKNYIYDIYGALVNKECVCEGYAKAFKYLADKAGLNSVIVVGDAYNSRGETENHSWNYIEINGIWYAIDCTWDDPVIVGGGFLTNTYKYKYFLKGSSSMSSDHFPKGNFSEKGMQFTYPQISQADY